MLQDGECESLELRDSEILWMFPKQMQPVLASIPLKLTGRRSKVRGGFPLCQGLLVAIKGRRPLCLGKHLEGLQRLAEGAKGPSGTREHGGLKTHKEDVAEMFGTLYTLVFSRVSDLKLSLPIFGVPPKLEIQIPSGD